MRSFNLIAILFFASMVAFALPARLPAKDGPAPDGKKIDLEAISFFEQYCFDEINRRREENGLGRLVFSEALHHLARDYSRRMAEEGFFSHTDPEGCTARERLARAQIKFTVLAENLLNIRGYIDPIPPAIEQWMQSPDHKANLLERDVEFSAIGVWVRPDGTYFFTQLLIGTKPQKRNQNSR
jgi:uncharacterized protein YkwD